MTRSVSGWTKEQRRTELLRLMQIAQDRYGWDRPTVLKALANRFAVHLNTVHGWVSIAEDGEASKRAQPAWQVIEILRFELGVTAPNGLDAFLNSPAVAE